jgi:hypothetical protein
MIEGRLSFNVVRANVSTPSDETLAFGRSGRLLGTWGALFEVRVRSKKILPAESRHLIVRITPYGEAVTSRQELTVVRECIARGSPDPRSAASTLSLRSRV